MFVFVPLSVEVFACLSHGLQTESRCSGYPFPGVFTDVFALAPTWWPNGLRRFGDLVPCEGGGDVRKAGDDPRSRRLSSSAVVAHPIRSFWRLPRSDGDDGCDDDDDSTKAYASSPGSSFRTSTLPRGIAVDERFRKTSAPTVPGRVNDFVSGAGVNCLLRSGPERIVNFNSRMPVCPEAWSFISTVELHDRHLTPTCAVAGRGKAFGTKFRRADLSAFSRSLFYHY